MSKSNLLNPTETHRSQHSGWLRAAVLGANDGIVSTASLILGVSASGVEKSGVVIAGVAGLVAGAMSMAAGEYVSVCSQSDAEKADLDKEQIELDKNPQFELKELKDSFMSRGVSEKTALDVATQLTLKDALEAHAREELNLTTQTAARPLQAALVSAITFAVGAGIPLLITFITPIEFVNYSVVTSTIIILSVLGAAGALVGGAQVSIGIIRVVTWGSLAMTFTFVVGKFLDVSIT